MGNTKTYLSTFITGFQELIPEALAKSLAPKRCKIQHLLDGLIVYETDAAIKDIIALPFFNNTFLHMADFPPSHNIKHILEELATTYNFHAGLRVKLPRSVRSFRLVISDENTTINPYPQLKQRLEGKIAKSLRLRIDPQRPDTEFWIILRREGHALLGMRLTKHSDYTTSLPKGALRPELAYLIAGLAPVSKNGTVLDPFAGSGSIAEACVRHGWHTVIASDFNRSIVQKLRHRVRKLRDIDTMQQDALELPTIKAGSIDAIITNPPWGSHFAIVVAMFYPKFFAAAHRVLKTDGHLVMLVENTPETRKVLQHIQGFACKESFNTLVSGKKAQVVQMVKTT